MINSFYVLSLKLKPKGKKENCLAITKEKKEKIVAEIKDIALKASSLVVSDARGLKVSEISEIRKDGNLLSVSNGVVCGAPCQRGVGL